MTKQSSQQVTQNLEAFFQEVSRAVEAKAQRNTPLGMVQTLLASQWKLSDLLED